MEGLCRIATMSRGVRQRLNNFNKLDDRTRPAMRGDEWCCVRHWRALMDEMDVQPINICNVVIEFIEATFLFTPIKFIAPIVNQVFHVFEISAVVPSRTVNFVRKPCPS